MSSNKHKHKVNEYHPYEEYVYDNMFSVHTMTFKLFDKSDYKAFRITYQLLHVGT